VARRTQYVHHARLSVDSPRVESYRAVESIARNVGTQSPAESGRNIRASRNARAHGEIHPASR